MERSELDKLTKLAMMAAGVVAGVGIYLVSRTWNVWEDSLWSRFDKDFFLAAATGIFYAGHTAVLIGHRGKLVAAGIQSGLMGLAVFLLGWQYFGAVGYGAGDARFGDAVANFYFAVHVAYFLGLTFLQAWRTDGRFPAYATLARNGWQNVVLAILPCFLTLLVFGILQLAASLFDVIHIKLLSRLLKHDWFNYPLSGGIFALTIVYLRDQEKVLAAAVRFLTAMLRMAGLVLCTAALVFLVCLPFTGIGVLWDSGMAASLLLSVTLLTGFYANAFVGDGTAPDWEGKAGIRQILVTAAVAAAPILLALAAWAFKLRIDQYGLTGDRVYSIPVIGIALVFACAYAWKIVKHRFDWVRHVGDLNIKLAATATLVAVLMQLAPFNVYKIATANQMARLESGKVSPDHFGFTDLKFKLAKPGREAFDVLFADAARLKRLGIEGMGPAWLKKMREMDVPWGGDDLQRDLTIDEFDIWPAQPELAPGVRDGLLKAINEELQTVRYAYRGESPCKASGRQCAIWVTDYDGAGAMDYVLFRTDDRDDKTKSWSIDVILFRAMVGKNGATEWQSTQFVGDVSMPEGVRIVDLLKAGKMKLVPPDMPDLVLEGKRWRPSRQIAVKMNAIVGNEMH